jgi:hypothetical protein
VMPPIAVMVSDSNTHAIRANTDIRVLSMRRKYDCDSDGRK